MQLQINSAMQGMKIDPSNLHASSKVLDQFDTLREEMLVYFSLDKFIREKHEERQDVREHVDELEALKAVYDKDAAYQRDQRHKQE